MATTSFKGTVVHTIGELPKIGTLAPDFSLVKNDLSEASLADYRGSKVILNIFPSVDTGVCAASVRHFNQDAAALTNTKVVCISRDLPFAQTRFCGAEGIKNVEMLSEFGSQDFGTAYGVTLKDGPLVDLLARAVIVLDENGVVIYEELVPEITQEPNYEAALNIIK